MPKATNLYNNGTTLLYVKDFLEYSVLASTEIYATSDSKKQREEMLTIDMVALEEIA